MDDDQKMAEASELLGPIPDWSDWTRLSEWAHCALNSLARLERPQNDARFVGLDTTTLSVLGGGLFGRFAAAAWRSFAIAAFIADRACYRTPADEVNFERLLYVMHAFPVGFRIWWMNAQGHTLLPVGYTAWYPISEVTFERLERADPTLADRMVPVRPTCAPGADFIFLFNYSIIPPLFRSPWSKVLLQSFAEDLKRAEPRGLAAITVSQDGIRVAERFGLQRTGTLAFEGGAEWIYTMRRQ